MLMIIMTLKVTKKQKTLSPPSFYFIFVSDPNFDAINASNYEVFNTLEGTESHIFILLAKQHYSLNY